MHKHPDLVVVLGSIIAIAVFFWLAMTGVITPMEY